VRQRKLLERALTSDFIWRQLDGLREHLDRGPECADERRLCRCALIVREGSVSLTRRQELAREEGGSPGRLRQPFQSFPDAMVEFTPANRGDGCIDRFACERVTELVDLSTGRWTFEQLRIDGGTDIGGDFLLVTGSDGDYGVVRKWQTRNGQDLE
jgi:hypothetical protein